MAKRGRQLIGQCIRAFQSRDPRFLVRINCTYVLPILNYGSSVWSLHLRQKVNELESVQKRFTRRLAGLRGYSYGERLRNLSLLSLSSPCVRWQTTSLFIRLFISRWASLYKTQDLISYLAILGGRDFRLLQNSATSVSASSHFIFRAASLWNSLPTDLLQIPKQSLFKSAIRNKLLADDLSFFD